MKKYKDKKHLPLKISSEESWAQYNKKKIRRYANTDDHWKDNLQELPANEQQSLLFKYALEGNKKMVKFLNENCDIDLNAKDVDGNSSLLFAVKSGKREVVDYLLKQGVLVDCVDNFGITPMHLAVRKNSETLVRLLLEYGADINIVDDYNQTPIFDAVMENNKKMIEYLFESGANINHKNNEGRTPLMVSAFKKERQEAMLGLLKSGAKVDEKDNAGKTAFMHTINNNNGAMMDILLKAKTDFNLADVNGNTPIMYCAKRGNREGLRVLISRGAKVLVKNNEGHLASDIAKKYGNSSCVDILKKAEKIYLSDLANEEKVAMLKEFAMHNRVQNSCIR